jgi:hypothetical protein
MVVCGAGVRARWGDSAAWRRRISVVANFLEPFTSAGKLATTMFVRFRQGTKKLALSLVETRRLSGKVVHEHIATLGSIKTPPAIHERIDFWRRLHERLAKLGNRIDPAAHGKLLGDIHSRVPMVTPDEQRALQLENAKEDVKHFGAMRDMHQDTVDNHRSQAIRIADTIRHGEVIAADANRVAAAAQERAKRIERGEDVSGGLGKPRTREDFDKELLAAGFTKLQLRRMRLLGKVGELGDEVFEVFLQSIRISDHADRAAAREARATLKLFSWIDPAERAEVAKEMLKIMKRASLADRD